VVLTGFHGDPLHNLALWAGAEALAGRGVRAFVPMHLILSAMMALEPDRFAPALEPVPDPQDRADLAAELKHDFHAGFLETSFMLHYRPDKVFPVYRTLPPCPTVRPARIVEAMARASSFGAVATELDYAAWGLGWFALRPHPGYSGRPHLANAASGRIIAEQILSGLVPAAIDVLDRGGEPVPPPMRWLLALTLDGRLDLTA
jgi:creatinine amidohydrolase